MINKIDEPLARQTNKNRVTIQIKIRNEREVIIDTTDIKRTTRD